MRDDIRRKLERLAREYGCDYQFLNHWDKLSPELRAELNDQANDPTFGPEPQYRKAEIRCPDFVPQAAIDLLAQSHRKMAITVCQYCGETTRQFPWLLDQPSTCQVCKMTGGYPK